jgi:hypothetical protein
MTLDEYKAKIAEDESWTPGWLAIDSVFETLYPNQTPAHFGAPMPSRALFGGDVFLDGISIYDSPNGYKHIVTYGMTELYANEEYFGQEWSGWGYEMSFKLKAEDIAQCQWALDMLNNLARYTYQKERFFEPFQYLAGNGTSIQIGVESEITGLLLIEDTQAKGLDTPHGRVDFIQLVGITTHEVNAILENKITPQELAEQLQRNNPHMVTDMKRVYNAY